MWEQSDIVLAIERVLNRNQVSIARKGTKREGGLASIQLENRRQEKVTQSFLKHLLSGPVKNAAACSCVSQTVLYIRDLGCLCVSLFLTEVHT